MSQPSGPPRPPPSEPCLRLDFRGQPQQYHHCWPGLDHTSFLDPFHRPNPQGQVGAGTDGSGVFGSSAGFSYGFVLWRYLLDWGDCVGSVVMKQGLVTCLKGWPRPEDRTAAAACLFRFVKVGDDCQPDLTKYLLRIPPFVGYTWDAHALKAWLSAVEPDPTCTGHAQFALGATLEQVQAWLEKALRYWLLLSSEPFPYDVSNMLQFWTERATRGESVPGSAAVAA